MGLNFTFPLSCRLAGLPEPVAEHKFHPGRKWRFDWAFPGFKIAVEQEGGAWTNGRHVRGAGYIDDMEKYNEAASMGWAVFRFTPEQIRSGRAGLFVAEHFRKLAEDGKVELPFPKSDF